jgi:hypothetical protein
MSYCGSADMLIWLLPEPMTQDKPANDLGAVVRAITKRYMDAQASGNWPKEPIWLTESKAQAKKKPKANH